MNSSLTHHKASIGQAYILAQKRLESAFLCIIQTFVEWLGGIREFFKLDRDCDANPAKEGCYRYTAAHEVGHWRLHRTLFVKDPAQTSFLDGAACWLEWTSELWAGIAPTRIFVWCANLVTDRTDKLYVSHQTRCGKAGVSS